MTTTSIRVLEKPIAALTVSDLTGHGLAVRRLVGLIDELPARAKSMMKELIDVADWTTWETCSADDLQRGHSPSAAYLSLMTGWSTRSIRRAYLDAEELGLLRRCARSWSTNRFVIDVSEILKRAKNSHAARVEARRLAIAAWKGGFLSQLAGRARRRIGELGAKVAGGGGGDAASSADDATGDTPTAGDGPQVKWDEVFVGFPAELSAELREVLRDAREAVEGRTLYWHDLQSHRGTDRKALGVLCVAVRALQAPAEPLEQRLRSAGGLVGKLGAIWVRMYRGPVELMLRDVAAMRALWGAAWWKKARPRDWMDHVERALHQVRLRTGATEAPSLEEHPDLEELLAKAAKSEKREADEASAPAAALEQTPAPAVPAGEAPLMPARVAWAASTAVALEALPELLDVTHLRPFDPARREVNRERFARQELADALALFHDAQEQHSGAQAALCRVVELAADLGLPPPD